MRRWLGMWKAAFLRHLRINHFRGLPRCVGYVTVPFQGEFTAAFRGGPRAAFDCDRARACRGCAGETWAGMVPQVGDWICAEICGGSSAQCRWDSDRPDARGSRQGGGHAQANLPRLWALPLGEGIGHGSIASVTNSCHGLPVSFSMRLATLGPTLRLPEISSEAEPFDTPRRSPSSVARIFSAFA